MSSTSFFHAGGSLSAFSTTPSARSRTSSSTPAHSKKSKSKTSKLSEKPTTKVYLALPSTSTSSKTKDYEAAFGHLSASYGFGAGAPSFESRHRPSHGADRSTSRTRSFFKGIFSRS